jgi:hypothetical protein
MTQAQYFSISNRTRETGRQSVIRIVPFLNLLGHDITRDERDVETSEDKRRPDHHLKREGGTGEIILKTKARALQQLPPRR